jgi:hypothetical protein
MGVPHSAHEWLAVAEHAALRVVMVAIGFALMILGLGLGVSMVMLPAGLMLGLTGVGVLVWGAFGQLPIEK